MFGSGLLRFVSKMKVSNRELPVRASMLQGQLLLIMTMMATLIFMWSLNFTGKDKEIGYLRIKETVFLLMSQNQEEWIMRMHLAEVRHGEITITMAIWT